MTINTEDWPKSYLLQLHAEAIKHGMILVHPICRADADSLRARFYRIRRRSDKSTASFIPQEYHMVNIGRWFLKDNIGYLPIIFNKLPDGSTPPGFTPAAPQDIPDVERPQILDQADKPVFVPESADDLKLDAEGISDFVAKMTQAARRKVGDE